MRKIEELKKIEQITKKLTRIEDKENYYNDIFLKISDINEEIKKITNIIDLTNKIKTRKRPIVYLKYTAISDLIEKYGIKIYHISQALKLNHSTIYSGLDTIYGLENVKDIYYRKIKNIYCLYLENKISLKQVSDYIFNFDVSKIEIEISK